MALVGFFVFLFAVLLTLLFSLEWILSHLYPSLDKLPRGLDSILPQATLRVFQEPRPMAIAIRGLGGKGTLFLSQGMLAHKTQSELNELILVANKKLRSRGAVFESFCWMCFVVVFGLGPSKRADREFSPWSMVVFWSFFPWITFWQKNGKNRLVENDRPSGQEKELLWETLPR